MKKIILILFLLLMVMVSVADSRMSCVTMGGAGTVTAGASCSYQSGQSCTVATDDSTWNGVGTYTGQGNYYPSSNMNVCQVDVWPTTISSSGNYTVYIFEMSGTSLGTEVCHTETKLGSAITTGQWNSFAITGDCNIVTGGTTKYGIVITGDASHELGDKAVSDGCTTQGGLATWGSDKAVEGNHMDDYDALFKLYGK
jgi:hypothetical protein